MAWAPPSPATRPASVRPISMPADTPAAVTYLPSVTTRSVTGIAPRRRSWSTGSPAEVARRPPAGQDARPGAPRGGPRAALVGRPDPLVHRPVVHLVVLAGAAGHHDDIRMRHVEERAHGGHDQAALLVPDEPGRFPAEGYK